MNTLWWIPLEKIDKRYTKMTRELYLKAFVKNFNDLNIIDGDTITSDLPEGCFLNPLDTIYFKNTQIIKIYDSFKKNLVKDGDVFFFDDIWFPSIESIKYMANMSGIDISIYGVLHAGSHTPSDDVNIKMAKNNPNSWVKHFEKSLALQSKGVFFGSYFHMKEFSKFHCDIDINNLIVSGIPYSSEYVKNIAGETIEWKDKTNTIVFPHRLHWEKQPEKFNKIINVYKNMYPDSDTKFIKTQELNLSKEDYYKVLSTSKVAFSCSLQENFGYSILESLSLGANILVNKSVSYKEFYNDDDFYDKLETEEDFKYVSKLLHNKLISYDDTHKDIIKWADNSAQRISDIILKMESK
jgi:glycosyltransferase involved in cell wall biosynthesis